MRIGILIGKLRKEEQVNVLNQKEADVWNTFWMVVARVQPQMYFK